MRNISDTNQANEKKEQYKIEELLGILNQNARWIEYIVKQYQYDEARTRILKQILQTMGERKIEETERQIYLYGSLTKGQDLIARQIFLWLIGMLKEGQLQEEK